MVADSLDELHRVARLLGLRREWLQADASYPHYDLTVQARERAIRLGVQPGNRRQIIHCARMLKAELQMQQNAAQLELFA
ncbi:MAG: DUF4031 domain-containing protein [Massilia sp.]